MNLCLNCGTETKNKYFCSITCQLKFQNEERCNKRYGSFKDFVVICKSCGKDFIVKEREKLHPQKSDYFCSRSCANKRVRTDETKEKIRTTLLNKKVKVEHHFICKHCGKDFIEYTNKKRVFCCRTCKSKWAGINTNNAQKGGLASVISQNQSRRSKNEIYFAELCKSKFKKVLTNESIFNGWDADVIIEDFKIAVLWNGNWHFKKITKRHSVLEVQNRDKIKLKEINKSGYLAYVIEDKGKHKKSFVEKEFEKFIVFLKNNSYLC